MSHGFSQKRFDQQPYETLREKDILAALERRALFRKD
jgi:hypothetical protein